jgi:hypothetical protein
VVIQEGTIIVVVVEEEVVVVDSEYMELTVRMVLGELEVYRMAIRDYYH